MSETIMSEDQVVWVIESGGAGLITGSVLTKEQNAQFDYTYSGDLITQMVRTTETGSQVRDLTYSGDLVTLMGSWY